MKNNILFFVVGFLLAGFIGSAFLAFNSIEREVKESFNNGYQSCIESVNSELKKYDLKSTSTNKRNE